MNLSGPPGQNGDDGDGEELVVGESGGTKTVERRNVEICGYIEVTL